MFRGKILWDKADSLFPVIFSPTAFCLIGSSAFSTYHGAACQTRPSIRITPSTGASGPAAVTAVPSPLRVDHLCQSKHLTVHRIVWDIICSYSLTGPHLAPGRPFSRTLFLSSHMLWPFVLIPVSNFSTVTHTVISRLIVEAVEAQPRSEKSMCSPATLESGPPPSAPAGRLSPVLAGPPPSSPAPPPPSLSPVPVPQPSGCHAGRG